MVVSSLRAKDSGPRVRRVRHKQALAHWVWRRDWVSEPGVFASDGVWGLSVSGPGGPGGLGMQAPVHECELLVFLARLVGLLETSA